MIRTRKTIVAERTNGVVSRDGREQKNLCGVRQGSMAEVLRVRRPLCKMPPASALTRYAWQDPPIPKKECDSERTIRKDEIRNPNVGVVSGAKSAERPLGRARP